MSVQVNVMSNSESEENICKNCGHKLDSHQKEKKGRCSGDSNENSDCSWCIANCKRFWE
jgi:hypothetical protein